MFDLQEDLLRRESVSKEVKGRGNTVIGKHHVNEPGIRNDWSYKSKILSVYLHLNK